MINYRLPFYISTGGSFSTSGSLLFPLDDWKTPQTVTVRSHNDEKHYDETKTISHTMRIGGRDYVLGRVTVTVLDTTTRPAGLTVNPASRQVSVNEGESATFTIVPSSKPSRPLFVYIVNYDQTVVSTDPGGSYSLDFRGDSWNTPQTVTVTAYRDDDEFDDQATLRLRVWRYGESADLALVYVTVVDNNRAPRFDEGLTAARSVPENSPEGTPVGAPVVATDLNNQTLTYEIEEQTGGPYTVDSETGQIRVGADPDLDFESKTAQKVKLKATDPGGLSDTIEVEFEVSDVNEAPAVRGTGHVDWAENRAGNLGRYAATDPEGDPFTWSVTGTDGDFFDIDSRGYLTFGTPPDFENPADEGGDNEYQPSVAATDAEGNSSEFPVTVIVTNVNEPPAIAGSVDISVEENSEDFSQGYTASDPEGVLNTFTWSLSGADGGDFNINQDGELTFRGPPDYERPVDSNRNNEYLVTIRAYDGQYTGSRDVMVTVNDVNEPPVIIGHTENFYGENETRPVTTYRATDPERDEITWSLGGADAGQFGISDRGVVSFNEPPDYEMPEDADEDSYYQVTVQASDGTNTATHDLTVLVYNAGGPEEPSITTTSRPSLTWQENRTGTLYTFRARDPQGGVITWSLAGADAGAFSISGQGALSFTSPPDFEAPADANGDNVYQVTVVATDAQGLTDRFEVTVTVTDFHENVEPTISTRRPPASYRELSTSPVYTFRATDPQRGAITWTLSGPDSEDFTIAPDRSGRGVLTFNSPPDFESPADADRDNVYELTVVATDPEGNSDRVSFTITVTDLPEDPVIGTRVSGRLGHQTLNYQENRTSTVHIYRASDPQRGRISWSLTGSDSDVLSIDSRGQLTFDTPPNFEVPGDADRNNRYEVTVVATDEQGLTDTLDVVISITNVNEGPVVTGPSSFIINENEGLPNASYAARDPEGDAVTRWTLGGRDGSDFTVSHRGTLTFRQPPDYERPADANRDNVYEVTVRPYDGRTYGDYEVTVTVNNVNEPPAISTSGRSATNLRQPENRTARLYTYRATDPEGGGTTTWSIGGPDARFFTINRKGEFSFAANSAPDFESPGDSGRDNVYDVTIQVSDDSSPPNTASLPVTVTVTAVNEGPEITSGGSRFTVAENQDWPGEIYTARDPEQGAVTRWALGGRDAGDFSIDERGLLTFRTIPDYERPADSDRNNIYQVEVRPYDGRYYGSHHVTVTVTPVNEAPAITTAGASATSLRQPENRTSRLYTYRARDPENRHIRWSVTGTHAGFFSINYRGELFFSESNPPDFESPAGAGVEGNEYSVTVQASDGALSHGLPVTVTVTNVNEGPVVILGGSSFVVPENQDWAGETFAAIDPDGDTVARWALGGRDGGDLVIDVSGLMTFRNTPDYERPADADRDNVYQVTVRPYDGRHHGSHDVLIAVTPVNEPPTITTAGSSATTLRQPENRTTRLYTYRATDPERGKIDWSVGGDNGGLFTIGQRGELSFREDSPPDFESPSGSGSDGNEYRLTVQASDGVLTSSLDVTVTVTDLNEGPVVTSGGDAFTVPENRQWAGASFGAVDPEGGAVTRWALGGRDGGDFVIDESGLMTFRNTPDFERPADADRDNVYEVEVRPFDGRYYGSHAVTVTVTDVSEVGGPAIITQPENFEGTLATYTAGGRGDLSVEPAWRLAGPDGGDFTISQQGELAFRSTPDHERPADSNRDNVYMLTVQASEGRYLGRLEVMVTVTPVNEPPAITTASSSATSLRHPENRTSRLYTYRATDPERSAVTWSVGGDNGSNFAISQRGELFFSETAPPDFENPSGSGVEGHDYQVTVLASDGANSAALPVTVTLTDVNEGPQIRREGGLQERVPENLPQETVLARYSALDPEEPGAAITRWSVSGRDGGDFLINDLGELRFRSSPDYERPADGNRDNVYEVTVRASDGRYTGTLEETQVITVTNVNEAPVITTRSRAEFTQREYTPSVIYTYRASDPDRQDAISWSVEGVDGGDFAIYKGILAFLLLPDYENPADADGDNRYHITIVAADQGGLRDTVDATVTVTEVNEGPKISGTAAFTVTEGEEWAGASFTAEDQEGDEIRRWGLAGPDGGDFTISETGVLAFRSVPDYDRPADSNRDNQYLVTVRAYDSGNRYGSLNVRVTVLDVNEEAPVVTGRESLTFRENTVTATVLHTYRATDSDRNTTFIWSVEGPDGEDFDIAMDRSGRGALTFRSPPDFEQAADEDTDNVYDITVVASDGTNRDGLDVTVAVTEVNEGPDISGTDAYVIPETLDNLANATFTATDPEGDDVTRWTLAGADAGDFVITDTSEQTGGNTAVLTFRNPPDVDRPADANRDNEYLVILRAYDRRGQFGSYAVTVTVTGANEPPVITGSDARTFRENATGAIYTYRATDPERDEFTWVPPGGADGDLFEVSDRGVLTFKTPPDFDDPGDENDDNEYEVTVQARDDQGNTGTFSVLVTVTDVNEGPTVTGPEAISVQEYTDPDLDPHSQILAAYSATDPEGSNIARWSLAGSDGSDFLVNEGGELTFRNAPDYDRPADANRDNVYLVTVRAHDATNRYGSLEVTVTVGSVNEAAPVVTGNQGLSFKENTTTTQRLHGYRATDADRNTTIAWSVRGQGGSDDGNAFDISDQGVLTFSSSPNYEQPTDSGTDNEYLVTVVASDDQGREGTLDVAVTVTDVNEGPEPRGTAIYTVLEGQSLTDATFTARDPDPAEANAAVTGWLLAGPDAGDFNIGPTGTYTAQLTFKSLPDFDRPADANRDNEYLVTLRAYNGATYGSLDITVNVTDQNEAEPTLTGSETLTFQENTETTRRLYAYRATDDDRDTTIAWTVEGIDGNDLAIEKGVLTFRSPPDYEQPADDDTDNVYEITVVASDGTNRTTLDVTITVTDVNEGPEITGQTSRTLSENFDDIVASYSGVDPDDTTTEITRWSVTGRDGGDFTINEAGDLSFRNPPDYERPADSNRDNEYEVTVRASDGRYYGHYDVTVTVEDINEAPEFRRGSRTSFTYREGGTSTLYTYVATDPEGDDFTWSTGGTDGSRFAISDTGVLTFGTTPDFDAPADEDGDNEYRFTVVARDDQANSAELEVTVTVTALNEGPVIADTGDNTALTVPENHDAVLFTYTATDPEDPDLEITRWSVTGRDGGDFTISEGGELAFRNPPDFERPADSNRDNEYQVTVRASDGRYHGTLDVTVTVEAVNETPEFNRNSQDTFSFQENQTSDLFTYRATDPEGGEVTWSLAGADRNSFAISEKGVFTFAAPPDYESPADSDEDNVYQVTVVAQDEEGNREELEVTVTVTNLTD